MARLKDLTLLDIDRRAIITINGERCEGTIIADPLFVGKLAFLIDDDGIIDIFNDDEIEFL